MIVKFRTCYHEEVVPTRSSPSRKGVRTEVLRKGCEDGREVLDVSLRRGAAHSSRQHMRQVGRIFRPVVEPLIPPVPAFRQRNLIHASDDARIRVLSRGCAMASLVATASWRFRTTVSRTCSPERWRTRDRVRAINADASPLTGPCFSGPWLPPQCISVASD